VRVNRIVPNLKVRDTAAANRFYSDALGLSISGDFGWVGFLTAPWGVRRFFFRDPDGNVVNVVGHVRS
jgi:catechol 2,3-dioxygenase-like lactoylglutathione lyase family enzyme